ncbi:glycosyl hydrolase family 81-domain-containing protein [Dactylonectria macrodidyma]|uniref:glucan endo-1,3-beta-D-glucosidase n=1 Tax=Dactylonectria macrodidyma TaxID=307937 RepID=A0A9P9I7X1_9HYPO|nr:glycosyl hydrolase family 81-domain-containing protein [Dactylonectria macrodidyma]
MKSHNVLPVWLLWLTQGQGLTIPSVEETSAGSWDESHEEFKRAETDEFEYLTTYAKEDIIPKSETVTVSTIRAPTGTVLLLPSLSGVEPHTEGFVITTVSNPLETEPPLLTGSIQSPTSLLQPVKTATDNPEETGLVKMATSNDIFANPIDTSVPLAMFQRQRDHPCPRKGITKTGPLSTNKFYSNFFLGDQKGPVYTFPYSLAWSAGRGPAASWGMAVSHIDASQRVFGPVQSNGAAEYYINPVGIQSMIISAKELGTNTVLTMDSLSPHYARAMLRKDSSSAPAVTFPIAQGSVFTTAYFSGATPFIQSGVYFKSMTRVAKDPKTNVRKFNFVLEDGTTWRLYAYKTKGDPLDLKVVNNGLASSSKPFYGLIQIAKDPKSSKSEAVLDNGCGIYPTGMTISGSAVGAKGTYTFTWSKSGHATGNLWMFALPHHVSSFDSKTRTGLRDYKLQTTTKGLGTAVGGTSWTMVEPSMPVNMVFAPWHTSLGSRGLSTSAKNIIKPIAELEVSQDMMGQSDLESMYFAGKALAKFGSIVYVINTLLGDKALGQAGLAQLKNAFAKFGSNKQKYPLVYETAWGGVVSSASYVTGDANVDFGNTYYNDHHFHYGYHILTAAFIGSMDSTWLAANKAYVNTLVRDIANPSSKDKYYPEWRSFDWYHGHSWAKGLFPMWDGANQESSSEDIMAQYAIKMWGTVIKDTNMVARANLQLAIMARSMQQYYYYTADNVAQPSNFIGNKVAGILFENKIHHTTFFDANIEAVQGIHMIPILPPSNLARTNKFVKEEWDTYFSNGRIDQIDNAWKGIIYANYATIEPKKAWDFFAAKDFDAKWIDGGASRTWYLAYAGGKFDVLPSITPLSAYPLFRQAK